MVIVLAQKKIITTNNLTKIYEVKKGFFRKKVHKQVNALDNVTFDIYDEELICLLGPNGAGKTTLIKLLTLLLLPTSGSFSVNGFEGTLKNEQQIKASIGAMLMGERGLYWKLTGRENLEYFYALYHQPKKNMKDYIDYLINLMNISRIADREVESYSSGQKMKFAFLRSLISDPPILILDEPTIAMDVQGARELRKIIKELHEEKKKTVLYSTHIMSEVEELADRVLIIDHGKIIEFDTVENLTGNLDQDEVISVEGIFPDVESIIAEISKIPGIKSATFRPGTSVEQPNALVIRVENSKHQMPAIITTLINYDVVINYISPKQITIEDVFIAKTGYTLSEDTTIK